MFDDIATDTQLFSGGLGCIKENTILDTIDGRKTVSDIQTPQVYYSKNDQGKLSLYPGTAPYVKGKDYLYRVVHDRGEFEVSLHHQIFCDKHGYLPLHEIISLFESGSSVDIPYPTTQEYDLLESRIDALDLKRKASDFLEHYAECIYQYGLQSQKAGGSGLAYSPLPFDAHTFDHSIYQGGHISHKDDQQAHLPAHNHLYQVTYHLAKMGYTHLQEAPGQAFSSQDAYSIPSAHTLQCNHYPLTLQSHGSLKHHHSTGLSYSSSVYDSYNTSLPKTSKILRIEKTTKQWFYDLHVFGSNNYLAEGAYHHNSGKTYLLCMKAIQLSYINRGFAGGFLAPTYREFKRDILPTMQEIMAEHGVKGFRYHKQDQCFYFPWSKAPLYVFTGEKPIAGPNLAYCLINEYSLIQYDRVREMLRRVRVKGAKAKQKVLAGTPEDIHGWLDEWVDLMNKRGDFKIVFAHTKENKFIDEDYSSDLAASLDEQALRVFASGEIGVDLGTDKFYYAYSRENEDTSISYQPSQVIYANMDFNVGKMSTSFCHRSGERTFIFNEIHLEGDSDTHAMAVAIIKEYCHDSELMKHVDHIDDIEKFKDIWVNLPESRREQGLAHIIITCDAAGKYRKTSGMSDVAILKKYGFYVRCRAANPRLRQRQLLHNGLLSKKKVMVNPDTCPKVVRDYKKVRQDKATFGKIKDKDDRLTHFSDGLDYFIDFEYTLFDKRNSTTIQL